MSRSKTATMRGARVLAGATLFAAGMALALLVPAGLVPVTANTSQAALPDPFADTGRLKRLTTGPMRHFTFPETAASAPEVGFLDAAGATRSLQEWRGKSVLVNFWAPWCASCREELPSLQHLKRLMGKQDFEVLLVNIDSDPAKAAALLGELGVDRLVSLQDGTKAAYTQLAGVGVPTSVLIDCHGRELGRIKGSHPWDSDQAVLLVKAMMRSAGCYDDQRDRL